MVWSIKVKPQIASQLFAIIFSESSMASRDKKSSKPSSSRGIRTLSDLNRPTAPDSDSDSDGPQEYYTGGEKRFLFSPSFFPLSMWIFCFPVWWLRNWRKRKQILILFIYLLWVRFFMVACLVELRWCLPFLGILVFSATKRWCMKKKKARIFWPWDWDFREKKV